jgi:hypothetical protein
MAYTKSDYEEDLASIQHLRDTARRIYFANMRKGIKNPKFDGFWYKKTTDDLDEDERKCTVRFRMAVVERGFNQRQIRQENIVHFMKNKQGELIRKKQGQWAETTDKELKTLRKAGCKVERYRPQRSRTPGSGGMFILKDEEVHEFAPKWKRITRDEAKARANEPGVSVRYPEDPTSEWVEILEG